MVTDTECLDSAENILDSAEHNLFGFVVGFRRKMSLQQLIGIDWHERQTLPLYL